jgi:hypothetical protein
VHRSDPGFSVGQSFVDPRTGEILKAALKMDTYRSITDYNIFAGLEPAMDNATEAWITSLDPNVNGYGYGNSVTDRGMVPMPRSWQLQINATY